MYTVALRGKGALCVQFPFKKLRNNKTEKEDRRGIMEKERKEKKE